MSIDYAANCRLPYPGAGHPVPLCPTLVNALKTQTALRLAAPASPLEPSNPNHLPWTHPTTPPTTLPDLPPIPPPTSTITTTTTMVRRSSSRSALSRADDANPRVSRARHIAAGALPSTRSRRCADASSQPGHPRAHRLRRSALSPRGREHHLCTDDGRQGTPACLRTSVRGSRRTPRRSRPARAFADFDPAFQEDVSGGLRGFHHGFPGALRRTARSWSKDARTRSFAPAPSLFSS